MVKTKPSFLRIMFAAILISLLIITLVNVVNAQNFTVRLVINNTENKVYIPGTGEKESSQIGDLTLYNPPHFYLASYLNNILTALVASEGIYIKAYNKTENHTLEITQELKGSRIFLVFSEGDYLNIEKNIGLVESGDFLSKISPTFAYGLGVFFPIKIVLEYEDSIDIEGEFTLRRGNYRLVISYNGITGDKPIISIKIA